MQNGKIDHTGLRALPVVLLWDSTLAPVSGKPKAPYRGSSPTAVPSAACNPLRSLQQARRKDIVQGMGSMGVVVSLFGLKISRFKKNDAPMACSAWCVRCDIHLLNGQIFHPRYFLRLGNTARKI